MNSVSFTFVTRVEPPRRELLAAVNRLHGCPDGVAFDARASEAHRAATYRALGAREIRVVCTVWEDGSLTFATPTEKAQR